MFFYEMGIEMGDEKLRKKTGSKNMFQFELFDTIIHSFRIGIIVIIHSSWKSLLPARAAWLLS